MRIIAGTVKGRKLISTGDKSTRPTADNVKEAMFSILGDRIHGARVLDLFAGSGALGIEALSRGAAHCTFVDGSPDAVRVIYENLRVFDKAEGVAYDVHKAYAQKFLKKCDVYDITILDPPYKCGDIYKVLPLIGDVVNDCIVYEHAKDTKVPQTIQMFELNRTYSYGIKSISVYTKKENRDISG